MEFASAIHPFTLLFLNGQYEENYMRQDNRLIRKVMTWGVFFSFLVYSYDSAICIAYATRSSTEYGPLIPQIIVAILVILLFILEIIATFCNFFRRIKGSFIIVTLYLKMYTNVTIYSSSADYKIGEYFNYITLISSLYIILLAEITSLVLLRSWITIACVKIIGAGLVIAELGGLKIEIRNLSYLIP